MGKLSLPTIHIGNCIAHMADVIDPQSVHLVCSSPPYWGLRDYGIPGMQWADGWFGVYGLEQTVEQYVAHTVELFEGIRRILRDDGVVFWNLGDTYSTGAGKANNPGSQAEPRGGSEGKHGYINGYPASQPNRMPQSVKAGNKLLVPYRVAIALQDAGWIVRQDNIWCLTGGAWLYAKTQKGEMPVMLKDLVRLRPESVCLWNGSQWTRVVSWTKSVDQNEKLEIVLRSGERIGCTGKHLWPTQRGNVLAENLRLGDIISTCHLPEPNNAATPEYLNADSLWFLGLYLAEGSRNRKSGNADSLVLSLNVDEIKWIDRLSRVAVRFGGSITYTTRGRTLIVRLYGRVLVATVEQFIGGRSSLDKCLTTAAWRLPNSSLRHIAHGYLSGDGSKDPKNQRIRLGFCRNYALERDIRTLAARLGATVTLNPVVVSYQGGNRPAFRGEWRWCPRYGHHNEKSRSEIVEIRRSRARKFWDVEVADEPHLFSLASGVLTHNCKKSPMPESVSGWRWVRCRQKTGGSLRATAGSKHAEAFFGKSHGARDGKNFSSSAKWVPCPGCEKCDSKGGYVLRRGSWRNTTAHEVVLMITKSEQYFCDGDAAAEATTGTAHSRGNGVNPKSANKRTGETRQNNSFSEAVTDLVEKRNPRSVWTMSSEPYKGAHFATYPTELPYRCIKVATSSAGCCPHCGAQWAPIVSSERVATRPGQDTKTTGKERLEIGNRDPHRHVQVSKVHGHRPTCNCQEHVPVPATVYDPFTGSGTTLQVAYHMGRNAIGSEIGDQYLPLIEERIKTLPRCLRSERKQVMAEMQRTLF